MTPLVLPGRSIRALLDGRKVTIPVTDVPPVGARYWVQEAWRPAYRLGPEVMVEYRATGSWEVLSAGNAPIADLPVGTRRWQPPERMPRWASRLTVIVIRTFHGPRGWRADLALEHPERFGVEEGR